MLASTYPLLDIFWSMLQIFVFIIWIWLLLVVFSDIFRSHDMGGLAKALWVILVVLLPYFGVLIYLIARGGSMHERAGPGPAPTEGVRLLRSAGGGHRGEHRRGAVEAGRPQVQRRDHRRRIRRAEGQAAGLIVWACTGVGRHRPPDPAPPPAILRVLGPRRAAGPGWRPPRQDRARVRPEAHPGKFFG